MTFEVWIAFIIASSLFCLTPGPTILLVLSQVMRYGKRSVVPIIIGTESANIVAMALSFLGMSAILATSATLFSILKYLGAIYLIYMGINAIRHKEEPVNMQKKEVSSKNIFKDIFLVTALNPKSIIFFIAFFPMFINNEVEVFPQMIILALSFMAVSVCTVIIYSVFSNILRNKVTSINFREKFNKFTGIMLISAGLITASVSK